jgi:hypothetical protein
VIALDKEEVRETLQRVDWGFPAATKPPDTIHSFHWFPGNFIPQIPSYLIQLLSESGEIVVDPFCGSGTTGVEALRLNRITWLSDVNRASIQLTKGKLAAICSVNMVAELKAMLGHLVFDPILRSEVVGRNGEGSSEHLDKWFHRDTLAQLRYIWQMIETESTSALTQLLEVLFGDVLFACAATHGAKTKTGGLRRHHWGWVADNVHPKPPSWHNAIKLFRDRMLHAIGVLEDVEPSDASLVMRVAREDARSLSLEDASADLVVTSPPYLGMIDYAKANRLTYLWMGWPLAEDREKEIGARYRRHRSDAPGEYSFAMRQAVSEIVRVLRPGRYCAIVIGASRKYPEGVDVVLDLFKESLTVVWGPEGRVSTRRRVTERLAREPQEWICVFQKPY